MKFLGIRDLYSLAMMTFIRTVTGLSPPLPKELIVQGIALAACHLSRRKRRPIEKNLSEAFGGTLGKDEIRGIVKGTFHEFWREIFSRWPSGQERACLKKVEIRGLENLRKAVGSGKGTILWESNGLGRRALSKQILHEHGILIHQVYGEAHLKGFLSDGRTETWVREHIIKKEMERSERPFLAEIIYLPVTDSLFFTRVLLDRLRENAILCIPGDGRSGKNLLSLKFLGQTELFSSGMVSLARISGSPILPFFCLHEGNGKISLMIAPPIHIEKEWGREKALEQGVLQYITLLESYIRRYPDQYRKWGDLGRPTNGEHRFY